MVLAVALSGLGSHPAAGLSHAGTAAADAGLRHSGAAEAGAERVDPPALAGAAHWTALLATLDRDEIAFVTIADGPATAPGEIAAAPRLPWLDAAMIACRVAPATARVGLVAQIPTVTTDPFMVSTQVATLDHVSGGRAGWEPQVSLDADAGGLVGPREVPPAAERYDEAGEHIEVVRRLWDSWDDDAEIRDVASNRFVDRERLHHIRYEGRYLRVIGPSITPRPPQGQPLIAIAAGDDASTRLAAAHGDVVFVDAPRDQLRRELDRVADAVAAAGRERSQLRALADVRVALDDDPGRARERLARFDDAVPAGWSPPGGSAFAGTPADLARLLAELTAQGADGARLHPAVLADDLAPIVSAATGALAGDGPRPLAGGTLRARVGLARPAGRYASAA